MYCFGLFSGPTSHSLPVLLDQEVRESTNKRRDPDRYRRLETSALGIGIGELGRNRASRGESPGWCARLNVRRGVLGGGGEECVKVADDLDWRAIEGRSRVSLERTGVGGEHRTAPNDVLGHVHVGSLGDVIDAEVVAPGVSGSILGLVVYVGPSSLEVGVLYMHARLETAKASEKVRRTTYRVEPILHVEADGVVTTRLGLDHTEHALLAVFGD